MTEKQKKWSETDKQGERFTKILDKILIKLDKMTKDTPKHPADYDVEKVVDMLSKVGNALLIKTNVALKTDWEKRLKYLEKTSTIKQTHEVYNTK